jgi:PAS domain S-box-containing protein
LVLVAERSASDRRDRDDFLIGGGEMGARMRAFDWSATPLGPPETWPQGLKNAVGVLLPSRAQICVFWGPDHLNLYNDAYRPILGLKHPWALGLPGREVWSEIWDDVLRPLLTQVVEQGEAFWAADYPFFVERHGFTEETYFDISYDPIRDESGAVGGVFCIVSETTGRVVGERRLKTLRQISEAATGALDSGDAVKRVADAVGKDPHDIPFALFYDHPGGSAARRCLASVGVRPIDAEAWPFPAEASEVVLGADELSGLGPLVAGPWSEPISKVVLVPMLGGGQTPIGWLVAGASSRLSLDDSYRDFFRLAAAHTASAVNAARALEEERSRARALAELDKAKTVFFSNVSHEFRTPITLMLSPIEEMLSTSPAERLEVSRDHLAIAHRNALRLLKLVNALLDFSRIEAGRMKAAYEPTDLATLTCELASNFRSAVESAGLKLIVDCPPLGEPVFVDRDMWETIVLNLISNAFKFTFEGEIVVSLRREDGLANLAVRDTGTGIAPDEAPRLFERFRRVEGAKGRTQEGAGIGLALVQELVKLHGGSIAVASEIGRGTTFEVSVPFGSDHLPVDQVASAAPTSHAGVRAQAFVEEALRWLPEQRLEPAIASEALVGLGADGDRRDLAGRRVLIADDNADMRSYVARLLAGEGYEVEATADGEAALAAALRRPPDLMLSDVMMPRLDGFALLKALRADPRTTQVPIILLSARAGEEAKLEGLQAGADDYLIKPFSSRELLARVGSAIRLAEVRREADLAIADENRRMRRLFESAPGFMAILGGPDHVFEFVNEAYQAMVGHRDLIGKALREALPEVADQRIFELLDHVYATGERVIGRETPFWVRRDPAKAAQQVFVDYVFEPVTDARGQVTGVFVEGYDVTDRITASAALKASEARFRTLANNIPILCWMAGEDGRVFWLNSRWYEYTGTSPDNPPEGGWGSLVEPSVLPAVNQAWRRAQEKGEAFEMVIPIRGADGAYRSFLTRMEPAKEEDDAVARWFGTNTDITRQLKYEAHLKLLLNELNHRVKNTLATVQSIAGQSFRGAQDLASASEAIESRLVALAGAHDIITGQNWQGAELGTLVARTLAPFQGGREGRICAEGPPVWLLPRSALGLAMTLHELATNAVKYGALSSPEGRVGLTWRLEGGGERLALVWREHGGPPVDPPARRGFGTRLIEQGLASEIGGRATLAFEPSGVVCTIEAALTDAPGALTPAPPDGQALVSAI